MEPGNIIIIINAPQAIDRGEGQGTAEVNGAGPSAMIGGGEGRCRAFSHGGGE